MAEEIDHHRVKKCLSSKKKKRFKFLNEFTENKPDNMNVNVKPCHYNLL